MTDENGRVIKSNSHTTPEPVKKSAKAKAKAKAKTEAKAEGEGVAEQEPHFASENQQAEE